VILTAAILLITTLTPSGAATSPDSFKYLDLARNIRAGLGLVLTSHDDQGRVRHRPFRELTGHPPLYAMVLSLFLAPDASPERAAARMAVVTMFLSGLLLFALLAPAIGPPGALLGALAFMVSQPILAVFSFAWSESLAIPLLLFGCWCCAGYASVRNVGRPGRRGLLLLLLVASLAALSYTRSIGVVFGVLLPVAWLLGRGERRAVPTALAVCLASAALVGAVFADQMIASRIAQGRRTHLLGNAVDALNALALQFSIHPAALVAAGAFSALWLGFAATRKPAGAGETGEPRRTDSLQLVLISCAGLTIYLVALVVARTVLGFRDRIDTRLVAPCLPFVVMLLCLGMSQGWKREALSAGEAALSATCGLLIFLLTAGGIAAYRRSTIGPLPIGFSGFPRLSTTQVYYDYTPPRNPETACRILLLRSNHFARNEGDVWKGIDAAEAASALCPQDPVIRGWLSTVYAEAGVLRSISGERAVSSGPELPGRPR
jgi:hypothetical protein